jgi:hypothetical protein
MLTTSALQQVVSYLRNTGCAANVAAKAAHDPKQKSSPSVWAPCSLMHS